MVGSSYDASAFVPQEPSQKITFRVRELEPLNEALVAADGAREDGMAEMERELGIR